MPKFFKNALKELTSQGFAVTVISIFLGASAAGWILTELIPPDFPFRREFYEAQWGGVASKLIESLYLYDPFHSIWYRAVLALFFLVLFLCVLTRWKSFIARAYRFEPPAGESDLPARGPRIEIEWRELRLRGEGAKDPLTVLEERYARRERLDGRILTGLFERIGLLLRKRGYRVVSDTREEDVFFTAVSGRWSSIGILMFHAGLLVITVGGMIGSYWGSTEFMSGRPGDIIPLYRSRYSILIDDFEIVMTERMEVKDYISRVFVLDESGDTVRIGDIEVNRPFKFEGYNIFQSSYEVDTEDFVWASVEYMVRGDLKRRSAVLKPGEDAALEDTPLVLRTGRFFPDFRIGAGGAFSASTMMANPALEVEITGEEGSQRGWLFLYNPSFNTRFEFPVQVSLAKIEPVYHTGLQISRNPGAGVLIVGIAVATIGLLFLYMSNFRVIKGLVGAERLVICGTRYRWKVSFEEELSRFGGVLRSELPGLLSGK